MNKIFNLVSTKLVVEKELLEAELEEVLNNRQDLELNKRLDKSIQLIKTDFHSHDDNKFMGIL